MEPPKISEENFSEREYNAGIFLPERTQSILKRVIRSCPSTELNYHHKLHRLLLHDSTLGFQYQTSQKKTNGNEEEVKYVFNRPNFDRFKKDCLPGTPLGQTSQIKRILAGTHKVMEFDFTPILGVCIGLGDATVYETGLALDFISGAPTIPASALRGSLRNFILSECFLDAEEVALQNDLFRFIFGVAGDGPLEGGGKAKVTFWGGFAADNMNVEQDLLNPHYQTYYTSGNENVRPDRSLKNPNEKIIPPGDWDMPIPVTFLRAVGTFKIFLSLNTDPTLDKFKGAEKLYSDGFSKPMSGPSKVSDLLQEWIQLTFFHFGIGAKNCPGIWTWRN